MAHVRSLLRSLAETVLRETVQRVQRSRPGAAGEPEPRPQGRTDGGSPKPKPTPPPRPSPASRPAGKPQGSRASRSGPVPTPAEAAGYPGDFTGVPKLSYAPENDSDADPGEVVWTWVPYEEDHRQGKDRPVLVIGHDGPWLLALPMTSVDHDRDARQEAAAGRHWCDIGSGPWDREGRPSEVRVNRILRVDPGGIRRIAARLDRERFTVVAREVLRHHG